MNYLYLKTHNQTGLKYLGKTIRDPVTYSGSGKKWKAHLASHGDDVTTEILFETLCEDELREKGLYYSELWNVVTSDEFANLIPESGEGAILKGESNPMYNKHHTIKTKEKISLKKKGSANPMYGVTHSEESRQKMRANRKRYNTGPRKQVTCTHCGKTGGEGIMNRWHFANCKVA